MRIVLDTNILARAHQLAGGPARRVLLKMLEGGHVLILSEYLLQELQRILLYPRLLKRSGLTPIHIVEYLEYLARIATLVEPLPVPSGVLRDCTDEPILGTAVAGRADVLCTRDADFFHENALNFCNSYGIEVRSDLELLSSLT